MRGVLSDTLVISLILGSEGQRSGTPRLTFWPSPRPGVQTEGGFAGNRLHGARHARRKLGGSLLKCAEGRALSLNPQKGISSSRSGEVELFMGTAPSLDAVGGSVL